MPASHLAALLVPGFGFWWKVGVLLFKNDELLILLSYIGNIVVVITILFLL